ncbi:hypothetical protein LLH03_02790 [bacterium]|nr:hypothetical protein [bacterium]
MIALWIEPLSVNLSKAALCFIAAAAFLAWVSRFVPARVRRYAGPIGLGVLIAGTLVGLCLCRAPDWDEMEHMHSSWLVGHGLLPFRDFWQHHSPLLWILLGPVVRLLGHTGIVCDFARVVAFSVSALGCVLVVFLARRLARVPVTVACTAFLCLGLASPLEFHDLRPDLFANALALGGLLLLVSTRSPWPVFASGALLGIAGAFTPKHLPLVAVLPVVILWEGLGARRTAEVVAAHLMGFLAGLAPLALWLAFHGLVGDFLFWVVQYNKDPKLRLGGEFPLLLVLLVGAWLVRVRADRWGKLRPGDRVMAAALVASVLMIFVQPFHKLLYGGQVFGLLSVAVGAGEAQRALTYLWNSRRGWVVGLIGAVYLAPTLLVLAYFGPKLPYLSGRDEIATLNATADGAPVVLVPSEHPISARDATDLNQPWQWYKWVHKPEIKARLIGIVDKIVETRPVLVLAGSSDATLVEKGTSTETSTSQKTEAEKAEAEKTDGTLADRLRMVGIIGEKDATRLRCFLQANYTLVRINRHYYWLRNDRPMLAGVLPVAGEGEEEEDETSTPGSSQQQQQQQ